MSSPESASATAELTKLAHTLGVPARRLTMLEGVPADDVRALREQVGEALFRADKHLFARIAALTKAVPSSVAARLARLALPPLIAARTTELLDPAKAVDMVGHLPDDYLTDIATALDPSRCPTVLAAIPPDRAARVARVLAVREEWVVIGGFVSYMSAEAVTASTRELTGEQLLHVGFVLDDLTRLDAITQVLTDRQVDELVHAAWSMPLWAELAEVVTNLQPERVARLAEHFRAEGEDAIAAARQAVADGLLPAGTLAQLLGA